jgi:uncharacterized protein YjbI with pentapeptide repeats
MKKAILYRSNCAGANMTNVDLAGASLYRCVLREAIITGANFKAAKVFKVAWPEGLDVPAHG